MADITTSWPGHQFCSWSVERPIGGGPISVGHAGCECGVEHPWQGRDEAHQRHVIEVVVAAAREDRDTTWKIAVATLMNALDVNGYDGATVLPDLLAAAREEVATILTNHQRASTGMTYGSPDVCTCGERIYVEMGEEEVTIRRARAFAAHQADALAAARKGDGDDPVATERDRVLTLVEAAMTPWTETARDNLLAAIKEARRCVITTQEESPHG